MWLQFFTITPGDNAPAFTPLGKQFPLGVEQTTGIDGEALRQQGDGLFRQVLVHRKQNDGQIVLFAITPTALPGRIVAIERTDLDPPQLAWAI